MFNLDKSIEQWLQQFSKHRAFNEGSIREMELHLRDHIDDLIAEGYSEQKAFNEAVEEFGAIPVMAGEEFGNIKRKKTIATIINAAMLRNFYFSTIRNLLKNKRYFLINISGLAIGIASFTFISLYIINEMSYDRFHSNHEHIFRVNNEAIIRGKANHEATSAAPMAKEILSSYPEVVTATRILKSRQLLITVGEEKINEDRVLYADSTFFKVFDFQLIKGNSNTALAHPRSIILSESYAKKYFGDKDPMGQKVTIEEDQNFYTVTGIVADVPANSHIQFDILCSLSTKKHHHTTRWIGTNLHTYIVLNKGSNTLALEEKMKDLFYKFMAPEIEYYTGLDIKEWEGAGNSVDFKLTPIKDIHLHSISSGEMEPTGNITYIYIYGLIAIVILFIAIFNFVNLATAHSATRAKEVGIRKVIGSSKSNLIYQFIFESVIVSIIATAVGIAMVVFFMPSFIDLIGKDMTFGLTSGYLGWILMGLLAIFIGILSGFYPSFVLSSFRPIQVLKGTFVPNNRAGWLRNLLVTIQFSASMIIIIGTLVLYDQIDYMLTKNLGFDKEQILVLKHPDWLSKNMDVFKNDLLKNPNISAVANSETIPGKTYDIRSYRKKDNPETFLFLNNQVTYDYQELLGLELVSGRFFSKKFGLDSNAVVLNEAAVKTLGYDNPVGKQLTSAFKKGRLLTIIGVVKNYNIESLHKNITPVSIELEPKNMEGYISIKMSNLQNPMETIDYVENKWNAYTNGKPFQYSFLDEEYQKLYQSESTTGQIFILFASLSIFIASLGLIGLITYTASIRKKEIGIRKVLGAKTSSLIRLLSGEIVRIIVIATIVAWPLSHFATSFWLENFANRISVGPWIYIGSTLMIMIVIGLTISLQIMKTTSINPIESLRQE